MNEKKIPVVIDCDTGIDDIQALSFALQAPLDILGITTVAGNQRLAITTDNTLNALHLMGRDDIPLAVGADKPLERELKDAGYIHGSNGLGGYEFPEKADRKPDPRPAWVFLADVLKAAGEPVTVIALGPLTNIAKLLMEFPEARANIKEIVFMGGSLRTGNPTPVSTFNVLCDPEAARYVIATKIPFVMCSLDCTRGAYVTDADREAIRALGNPVAEMVATVNAFYRRTTSKENTADGGLSGVSIHDLATVMYVTDPELFVGEWYYADVETKGELTTGFTLVDYENNLRKPQEDKTTFFLKTIDREKFVALFLEALKKY